MRQPTGAIAARAAAPQGSPAAVPARAGPSAVVRAAPRTLLRALLRAAGGAVVAAALAAAGFVMLAAPAGAHDCKCRYAGRDWSLGERACFRLDGDARLMECRMNQNITAWVPVADGCPSAAAMPRPGSPIAAPAGLSRPAPVTMAP